MGWIITAIIAMILLLAFFLLNFYRDPPRKIPKGNNIVAPADGKIISIINTSKNSRMRKLGFRSLIYPKLAHNQLKIKKHIFGKIKTLTGDIAAECCIISIFMSPLDVHINRAPIDGTIKSIKHSKGKFFKAYDLEKSLENEKNEIVIENKKIKVKVIQIAGFLARRIKCYVKKNQKVNKGDKIGMIALSSQTTLILPKGVDLKVKVNDKVKAGETIIAILK
ncbi:MAG: phosphatidylserine decarboxylase [Nanoarchaeota archaeon]|nr:phosphatidylserine decarboxylase [Nanoarchaeota archaeon]